MGGRVLPAAGSLGPQTPWPRMRACSGRGSSGSARQLSPVAQRAVATPQAEPSGRAHIGQQPQLAGGAGSAQESGTGGQRASFSGEQGAQCHGWGAPAAAPSCRASRSRSGQAQAAGTSGIV